MPEGYSEFDTDCDDSDATVNPDKMWYPDADQDGSGFSLVQYNLAYNQVVILMIPQIVTM